MLHELEALDKPQPWLVIPAYAALGEYDKAFEWLHHVVEEHNVVLWLIRIAPIFDELRRDPRWAELMVHLEREEQNPAY